MGRAGDDIGIRHRRWVHTGCDQASKVCHIRDEKGADFVGDVSESGPVNHPRIGCPPCNDDSRSMLARETGHGLQVHQPGIGIQVISDSFVEGS